MVNEQVVNKDNRILDYDLFIPGGKPHPISTPDRLLVVGQEYRPAFYGHIFMFQLRDHLIGPYTTGYEGTAIESLYPSDTWFEGLRKGRAFVTTGPLVDLAIDDRMPGDEIKLPATGGEVDVAASVQSITPLESVTLIWNGEIVERIPLSKDRKSAQWNKKLKVSRSGWYHLRAEGNPKERYPLDAGFAQAFTNPVWVTVGDRPVRNAAAADYCLQWIDKLQQLAEAWPGWRSQQEKTHVYTQFDQARAVYKAFRDEAMAGGVE